MMFLKNLPIFVLTSTISLHFFGYNAKNPCRSLIPAAITRHILFRMAVSTILRDSVVSYQGQSNLSIFSFFWQSFLPSFRTSWRQYLDHCNAISSSAGIQRLLEPDDLASMRRRSFAVIVKLDGRYKQLWLTFTCASVFPKKHIQRPQKGFA